jgi:hypothetical protein
MRYETFEYRRNRRNDRLELNRRDRRQRWQRRRGRGCFEMCCVRSVAKNSELVCLWSTSCNKRYGQKPDTYESAGF